MPRGYRLIVFVLLSAAAWVSLLPAQSFNGSDNVQRFLGQWNLLRDGWEHSIEITFREDTDFDVRNPLIIKYYDKPNCQGEPVWVGEGMVKAMKSTPGSHLISFLNMKAGDEREYFLGYIFNQGGSRGMAGTLEDKWGKFAWYAEKIE